MSDKDNEPTDLDRLKRDDAAVDAAGKGEKAKTGDDELDKLLEELKKDGDGK